MDRWSIKYVLRYQFLCRGGDNACYFSPWPTWAEIHPIDHIPTQLVRRMTCPSIGFHYTLAFSCHLLQPKDNQAHASYDYGLLGHWCHNLQLRCDWKICHERYTMQYGLWLFTTRHTVKCRDHVQSFVYRTNINVICLQIFRVHVLQAEL